MIFLYLALIIIAIGIVVALLFLVLKMMYILILLAVLPRGNKMQNIGKIMDMLPNGRIILLWPFSGWGRKRNNDPVPLEKQHRISELTRRIERLEYVYISDEIRAMEVEYEVVRC